MYGNDYHSHGEYAESGHSHREYDDERYDREQAVSDLSGVLYSRIRESDSEHRSSVNELWEAISDLRNEVRRLRAIEGEQVP